MYFDIFSTRNLCKDITNIRSTSREHSVDYQPQIQAGYQPEGRACIATGRLIPSLIRGLILDGVSPSRFIYIFIRWTTMGSKGAVGRVYLLGTGLWGVGGAAKWENCGSETLYALLKTG